MNNSSKKVKKFIKEHIDSFLTGVLIAVVAGVILIYIENSQKTSDKSSNISTIIDSTSETSTSSLTVSSIVSSEVLTTQNELHKQNSKNNNTFLNYAIKEANNEIIVEEGKKILLKSEQSHFLTHNEMSFICASKKHPTIDDAWTVHNTGNEEYYTSFYSESQNKYLSCENNKYLTYNENRSIINWLSFSSSENEQNEQHFRIIHNVNDPNFVEIQSQSNNRYWVSQFNDYNYPILSETESPKAWEQYSLYIYNEDEKVWVNPLTGIKYEAF